MSNPVMTPTGPQWGEGNVLTMTTAPFNVGDLMAFAFISTSGTSTAISGGGVSTWTLASSYLDTVSNIYAGIWWGVVKSTQTSTLTVTDPGFIGYYSTMWMREFTAPGANWSVVAANPAAGTVGGVPGTSGPEATYPALSPSGGGNDLYVGVGYAYDAHMLPGSTPGFIYGTPGGVFPNTFQQVAYNWTASTPQSPTAPLDGSSVYLLVAAMFTAGGGQVTSPAYATAASDLGGGPGSWVNPSYAEGPPDGSFATWTSP